MGSQQQPFGYNFAHGHDPPQDENYGPPLLDDLDSDLLNSFFSNPDAIPPADHAASKDSHPPHPHHPAWPPTFYSASTVTDPLRVLDARSQNTGLGLSHEPPSLTVPGATDQELLAASTLFNAHGLHTRFDAHALYAPNSNPHASPALNGAFHSPTERAHHPPLLTSPSSATSSVSYPRPPPAHSQQPSLDQRSPSVPNMVFGWQSIGDPQSPPSQAAAPRSHHGSIDSSIGAHPLANQRAGSRTRPFAFGSDSSFSLTGFQLPGTEQYERNSHHRLVIDHLSMVDPEALQKQLAEDHKQQQEAESASHRRTSSAFAPQHQDAFDPLGKDGDSKPADEAASQSRKRRRNTQGDDEDDEAPDAPKGAKARATAKSKSAKEANGASTAVKRRKSYPASLNTAAAAGNGASGPASASAAGGRGQRENLTEEQKRSNHIQSEQKRRNLIRYQFEQLNELVPALRNSNGGAGSSGMSKNQVLQETGDFLDMLLQDNHLLRQLNGIVPDPALGPG